MSAQSKRLAIAATVTLTAGVLTYFPTRQRPASPEPSDPIQAIVTYFHQNGIDLEKDEHLTNWWVVTKPSGGDFRVAIAIKAYPLFVTDEEMSNDLLRFNLAFRLNAPAHIAMSYPSGRRTSSDSRIKDPGDEETSERLLELFDRYLPNAPR